MGVQWAGVAKYSMTTISGHTKLEAALSSHFIMGKHGQLLPTTLISRARKKDLR